MTYPHRPHGTALARPVSHAQSNQWTARRANMNTAQAVPAATPMRRFEALSLMPNGDLVEIIQRAPSHPETDVAVNLEGYISVTPMRADYTAHDMLDTFRGIE